jgi:hypothetical protein
MSQTNTVQWRCPNSDCKWSMVATTALAGEPAPRCVCGEQMQRLPGDPGSSYLGFLQRGFTSQNETAHEED